MFTNTSSHKTFYSDKAMNSKSRYYLKSVKYYVSDCDGFAVDYEMYLQIREQKEGILFSVPNDLHDFYKERKTNRTVIAISKGKYLASNEVLAKCRASVLNPKYGKQLLVPVSWCEKVG